MQELSMARLADVDSNPNKDTLPRVFDYIDFREYLKNYYSTKKRIYPTFSFGQFAKKARIPTRNYLKRVMDGERPLSNENLPKFILALDLNSKESAYFEALVHYSQAKDPLIKKYYFEQLRNACSGVKGSYLDLHSGQYEIFQDWYIVPLYEYFALKNASQDIKTIVKHFKEKLSPKEIKEAIDLLCDTEILVRDPLSGSIKQKVENIRCENNLFNMAVRNYHKKMLEMTAQCVECDNIEERYLKATTVAVKSEDYTKMAKEVEDFLRHINQKYSTAVTDKDALFQVNIQLLKLTENVNLY